MNWLRRWWHRKRIASVTDAVVPPLDQRWVAWFERSGWYEHEPGQLRRMAKRFARSGYHPPS